MSDLGKEIPADIKSGKWFNPEKVIRTPVHTPSSSHCGTGGVHPAVCLGPLPLSKPWESFKDTQIIVVTHLEGSSAHFFAA